jgi:phosphatidate cytidylyltransferase
VFIFCSTFFFFSNFLWLKIILFSILFACISSDIGGFIFGKIFKGPKLTRISPNKTYSGSIGAIFLTLITVSILFYFIFGKLNLKIILIALTTSFFCQIGDLIFSFLKRKAKFKDTGNFLPGHGGILDRLDGIFLGIPFGFLALILLN